MFPEMGHIRGIYIVRCTCVAAISRNVTRRVIGDASQRCIFNDGGSSDCWDTHTIASLRFHYCRRQHLHLGFFFRVTCSTCEASPGPCAVIRATSTVAALDAATCTSRTPFYYSSSYASSFPIDEPASVSAREINPGSLVYFNLF